jgi:hypothetical protein
MRAKTLSIVTGAAITAALAWVVAAGPVNPAAPGGDAERIAALVHDFESMTPETLDQLPAVPMRRFELPDASVHVMRARLEETYSIDGVGRDTVELTGWIAVRHDNARPAGGQGEVTWSSAVLDTEFVGMHLSGHSDLLGSVEVRLDHSRPSRGQVGQIEIPELAELRLLAELRQGDPPNPPPEDPDPKRMKVQAKRLTAVPRFEKLDGERVLRMEVAPVKAIQPERLQPQDIEIINTPPGVFCAAPLGVEVLMSDLGLSLTTEGYTVWYSIVDTIPPVGQTASITIEPVRLLADGRAVGTLESGMVKFRQVVRRLPLLDVPATPSDRLASRFAAGVPAGSGR